MAGRNQRIRDPLHNLIEFSGGSFEQMLWKLIQTPAFQRLRRVKQLGFSEFVYPGATHTRFAHSLGVYHLAKRLIDRIHTVAPSDKVEMKSQSALAASLLHDIGHGPFSHAFEDAMKRARSAQFANSVTSAISHEAMSEKIILSEECGIAHILREMDDNFPRMVARVITSPETRYGAVVSSQFDADRLDYMQRDRLMTGTQVGSIDLAWLIANLELGQVQIGSDDEQVDDTGITTFVLNKKALHAAESYILNLFHLYPTIYFHKATRCAEKIFSCLFARIVSLIDSDDVNKTGLPQDHPLVRLIKDFSPRNYLQVDDTVIMGSLPLLMQSEDALVKDFSGRLWERRLYKCAELYAEVDGLDDEALQRKKEKSTKAANELLEWSMEHSENGLPRILFDKDKRNPYKRFDENKGALNQIYIATSESVIKDIKDLSLVAKGAKPFEFCRLYYRKSDKKTRKRVEAAISEILK